MADRQMSNECQRPKSKIYVGLNKPLSSRSFIFDLLFISMTYNFYCLIIELFARFDSVVFETKMNDLMKVLRPVTPAKAGVYNPSKILDSGFRRNDSYDVRATFFETVKLNYN